MNKTVNSMWLLVVALGIMTLTVSSFAGPRDDVELQRESGTKCHSVCVYMNNNNDERSVTVTIKVKTTGGGTDYRDYKLRPGERKFLGHETFARDTYSIAGAEYKG